MLETKDYNEIYQPDQTVTLPEFTILEILREIKSRGFGKLTITVQDNIEHVIKPEMPILAKNLIN